MQDKNNKQLQDGDIIDIHETINGVSVFIVVTVDPLDVRYNYDPSRKYEYPMEDLIKPCQLNGDIDFEIIGNIYDLCELIINHDYKFVSVQQSWIDKFGEDLFPQNVKDLIKEKGYSLQLRMNL